MKNIRLLRGLALCVGIYFMIYGCAPLVVGGVAAGTTYAYKEGWVERDYSAGLERTYNAGLQAARDLGMTIVDKELQVASAEIKARKGEQDYWLKMKQKSQDLTTLSIRAGITGDKAASQKIHEAVLKQL